MSTVEPHPQLREYYGHTDWPGSEEESIPDPLPFAGRVVKCPACGHKSVEKGYPSHYWRRHGEGSKVS